MSSVNKAIIVGRLGADPEVRYTQSNTPVATLNVATSEKYKDKSGERQEKTEWHRVVLWARTAEIASQYLRKGSLVYIEGSIQTREWEDKEGQKRYTTEINGRTLQMLSSNNNGDGQGQGAPQGGQPQQQPQGGVDLGGLDDIDDDLPF